MGKTYYEMLGLREGASVREVKRAYRRWLFVHHLYKNFGNNKFEKIFEQDNEIYRTLSNRVSRIAYKTELRERKKVKTKSNAWYRTKAILFFIVIKLVYNLLSPSEHSDNLNSTYAFTSPNTTPAYNFISNK